MKGTENLNNQMIFSTKELKERGYSQYKVNKLVKEGKLIKLTKSYYENTEYDGEDAEFYYIKAYTSKGIVCLLSAAVYYDLTTYIPDAIDVAIPRKAKVSTIPEWPPMNIHYYTDARYEPGVVDVKDGENEFQIYDMEKTVVDMVFYKEKIGIEEMKEVLNNYLYREDRDIDKLLHYSKLMKCEDILRQYLEVLL